MERKVQYKDKIHLLKAYMSIRCEFSGISDINFGYIRITSLHPSFIIFFGKCTRPTSFIMIIF